MSVTALRHCESAWNADPSLALRDPSLTAAGRSCAATLRGRYDVVVCSPLARARETLGLSEIVYDTVVVSPLAREHKTDPCDFFAHEPLVAESEEEVLGRATELKRLLAAHAARGETVLLVSHADLVWYLTSSNIDGERFGVWLGLGETCVVDSSRQLFS